MLGFWNELHEHCRDNTAASFGVHVTALLVAIFLNWQHITRDLRRPRWILGYSMAVDGHALRVLERQ